MAFFEIKNLIKTFGGLTAVDNLNLAVEEKENYGVDVDSIVTQKEDQLI